MTNKGLGVLQTFSTCVLWSINKITNHWPVLAYSCTRDHAFLTSHYHIINRIPKEKCVGDWRTVNQTDCSTHWIVDFNTFVCEKGYIDANLAQATIPTTYYIIHNSATLLVVLLKPLDSPHNIQSAGSRKQNKTEYLQLLAELDCLQISNYSIMKQLCWITT